MTPSVRTLQGSKIKSFKGSASLCPRGSNSRGFSNTLLNVFIVVAALLLIGVVLAQKSKGAGLVAQLGDFERRTGVSTKFAETATLTLAGVIIVTSIICAYLAP